MAYGEAKLLKRPGRTSKILQAKADKAEAVVSRDTATEADVADFLGTCYADPLRHVMYSYPWKTEPSIQLVKLAPQYRARFPGFEYGPDVWACEFLDELGKEIRRRGFDGKNAVMPIQFATKSGHGIGKSVIVAWLIKFIMDTRPYAKGVVTATTADQLKTKTWAEVGKWHKMSLTYNWFNYSSGRGAMALTNKVYKEQWRCDAQTSKEENSESFAGLHAANSTPFYIFDEASGVPDKIFEVREGGTTDGEPMVFDFGNPTRNTGRFFENCAGRFRNNYIVRSIDSREVAITNKQRIEQWRQDYGEDSDFFKVRVRGEFPSAGTTQFIPTEYLHLAQARPLIEDKSAPLIIGVDVARFGNNESVICIRLGNDCRSFPAIRLMGLDTVQLTGKIIEVIRKFQSMGKRCSGLFVDGSGVGGGVVDQLRALGYNPIEVHFGGKPNDPNVYRFKVDEMWGLMKQALKDRLCMPTDKEPNAADYLMQLTQREFGYTVMGHKIQLESKSDMAERLGANAGASPDLADALCLTFAQEVVTLDDRLTDASNSGQGAATQNWDYDPLNVL